MMKLVIPILIMTVGFTPAFAFEPIPITISDAMDKITFDGKWSHVTEWKESSLNIYNYDDGAQIILRSAHQGDSVYIFLDSITDFSLDRLKDQAIICFDTRNDKSPTTDSGDYCFSATLGGNSAAYKGGRSENKTNYEQIVTPDGFIGISSASDGNDRYVKTSHPSYEFKIPTSLIGRESVYGFYFLVYDEHLQKSYTYPQNLKIENFVSNPDDWGEIYSPDKSLPEFGLPQISLILSLGLLTLVGKLKISKQSQIK